MKVMKARTNTAKLFSLSKGVQMGSPFRKTSGWASSCKLGNFSTGSYSQKKKVQGHEG